MRSKLKKNKFEIRASRLVSKYEELIDLFSKEITKKIEKSGVIAVLVLDEAENAVPLAKALLAGGVDMMELTLRTPAALAGLKNILSEVPEMTEHHPSTNTLHLPTGMIQPLFCK